MTHRKFDKSRKSRSLLGPDQINLTSGISHCSINLLGAEVVEWHVGARSLLWSGDAAWWSSVAPILFPLCGALARDRTIFDGVAATIPVHGFAATSRFEPVEIGADTATLRLTDTPRSHSMYPFSFALDVHYRLEANRLTQQLWVHNTDSRPLPYSIGVHPGFALPGGAGEIVFAQPESHAVPVIRDRMLTAATRSSGVTGRRLALTGGTFARGGLCFFNASSPSLELRDGVGNGLGVRFEGFPHLILWGRPGAAFVAVEGWTGHGDSEGFAGAFAERPSTLHLAPAATAVCLSEFTVL